MQPRQHLPAVGAARSRWPAFAGALGVVTLLALSVVAVSPSVGASSGSAGALPASPLGSASAAPAAPEQSHPSTAAFANSTTLVNVTFEALRLPQGSLWSVTAGSPAVTTNNTTAGAQGRIVLQAPDQAQLNFSIAGPAGYGVAKVVGKGIPSQTSDFIGGTTLIKVFFAPVVTLTFRETGLFPGTVWGIAIQSALPHGGPAPQSNSSNGTTVTFQIVKGTYRFQVTPAPTGFKALPARGHVGTGHPMKMIKFRLVSSMVLFRESGLSAGTRWQVNVTGSLVSESLNSTSGAIRFHLPAGNYTFTVWNFTTLHPTPESGTLSVTAPSHATVVKITYAS